MFLRDSDCIQHAGQQDQGAIEGLEPIKEHLLIAPLQPGCVDQGQMLSLEDICIILRIKLIGVIPASEPVLQRPTRACPLCTRWAVMRPGSP